MAKRPFDNGMIVEFRNPLTGQLYDGVVWRVLGEGENSYSLYVRFVDEVNE